METGAEIIVTDMNDILDLLGHQLLQNAELDPPVQGAGHFLQEDQGQAIGRRIAAFGL